MTPGSRREFAGLLALAAVGAVKFVTTLAFLLFNDKARDSGCHPCESRAENTTTAHEGATT